MLGACQKCDPSSAECHETDNVNLLSRRPGDLGMESGAKGPRQRRERRRRRKYYHGNGGDDDNDLGDTAVQCYYNKTYAYPLTVVQVASGNDSQMISRCSDAGEDYVNTSEVATCILNSNGDGYDYDVWYASRACPYPAGATEYPIETTQADCENLYNNFTNLGDYVTMDDVTYKTGIGHGVLKGVRGNCWTMHYNGKYAVIFQVDIRSWSLEVTEATLNYLLDNEDPGT